MNSVGKMENTEFLKYFINEDLYLVDSNEGTTVKVTPAVESELEEEVSTENITLVEEPAEAMELVQPLAYKGGNEKGILILVEDSTDEFLNESDLAYLLKILGAVKLSLADIALVNVHRSKNYAELDYNQALVFTANHSFKLPNPTKYSPTQLEGLQILLADPLNQIAASVELRKALWGSLKAIYA